MISIEKRIDAYYNGYLAICFFFFSFLYIGLDFISVRDLTLCTALSTWSVSDIIERSIWTIQVGMCYLEEVKGEEKEDISGSRWKFYE